METTFGELEQGDTFSVNGEGYYLRTLSVTLDDNTTEYNTVNMFSGDLLFFSSEQEVKVQSRAVGR